MSRHRQRPSTIGRGRTVSIHIYYGRVMYLYINYYIFGEIADFWIGNLFYDLFIDLLFSSNVISFFIGFKL